MGLPSRAALVALVFVFCSGCGRSSTPGPGHLLSSAVVPPPIELEAVPGGPLDLSATGTPFPGSMTAGATLRLKIHAKLDQPSEHVYKAPPGVRARVEIVDADGGRYVLDGPAGPWPTA